MITGDEALYLAKKFVKEYIVDSLVDVYNKLNGKVDKVSGKGLSTNDFTNTHKEIVEGLIDVVTPSFNSLPKTFYSPHLKSSCKLVGNTVLLSTPKAGDINWNVTFANGSLTISGTFHGNTATTAKMSIWIPKDTITLTNS